MTEDEAKEKTCPIMYCAELGAGRCLASDCACWVWVGLKDAKAREGHCGLIK